ncbi:premnaspirodiene oxygenase [Phtheirospermum japonicum]|uniref:Premnaspirodiene oxygenase n=1 Tax=Phtheirospermum japonicum TaxID=374723 RepID=A0A830C1Q5_9LAMI|nr:premnaspirodiene oxygenase [Phtheirospermum japonicum]
MEFDFSFVVLVSFFIFVLVLHKLGVRPKTIKPKRHIPPGPWKLPFIGNLHLFVGSIPPQHILRDLAKKYGSMMHLRLGEVDNIIVSSSETAIHFMKTHDKNFANRPSLLAAEANHNRNISFAPYGEYWRHMRKICTLELLTAMRVRSFWPIREEEVLDLCNWIARHEGENINLTERISLTNYDIMVRASVGKKNDEKAEFIATVKEIVKFISVFSIADVYPSIKFLALISGTKRKLEEVHRKLDKMMTSIVEERKRTKDNNIYNNDEENKQEDLLDVLLSIQSDGSLELPLTRDNIKYILVEIFSAGAMTSEIVVDWAMAEMLNNPETMKKAQEEVRQVFDGKGGGRVDESCFNELKYLRLVIKETLRMHPPAPLLLPRENRERCEIDGYEIPAKTWVLVNAWAIGRDPEYWEDAERFKPERFLEKADDFKGNSFNYIPFGAGRRICPGILFGLANVEIQLVMFLYYFDWVLADGVKAEEMDMIDCCGVEGRRKHSLSVIAVVRRPLPV